MLALHLCMTLLCSRKNRLALCARFKPGSNVQSSACSTVGVLITPCMLPVYGVLSVSPGCQQDVGALSSDDDDGGHAWRLDDFVGGGGGSDAGGTDDDNNRVRSASGMGRTYYIDVCYKYRTGVASTFESYNSGTRLHSCYFNFAASPPLSSETILFGVI